MKYNKMYSFFLECKTVKDCRSTESCHHVGGSGISICLAVDSFKDDDDLEIVQTNIQ